MHLDDQFHHKSAVIGIVGLGYVGLPLLRRFWEAGFPVIGFDVDPEKIRLLRAGESYLKHLGEHFVREMLEDPRFQVTDDMSRLSQADAVLVCVPTPLGEHREPDLSYVAGTADQIAQTLRPGQLIVLESTTYPGTTREILLPRLETRGLRCGTDFYLAYSPEREDPGRNEHTTATIPKLIGGIDDVSRDVAVELYRQAIADVVPVASAEIAEAAKLLENVYRSVNIALVNELKTVLTAMDIDVWAVIDAAATKPFGFQAFYPGPGLGGHCIPIDPFYLTWKAREFGCNTRFIELAGEVNHAMPEFVIDRVAGALNCRQKAVNGARLLIVGLAYKPNVDDIRESPSFVLIERLHQLGASVDYHDPHVPATKPMRRYNLKMTSVPLTADGLESYDAVIIATHHDAIDWQLIADHAPLIVDTRGVMRHCKVDSTKVVSA